MNLPDEYKHPEILVTGRTNTVGFPSISVPGGIVENGMPVGTQFIGALFNEATLYQVSHILEQSM